MQAIAKLKRAPTSPRKMRLIADLIRGLAVDKALNVLKYTRKQAAMPMGKLLVSAIANWQQKHLVQNAEQELYVHAVAVDSGRMLKRIRPAPQGRAHTIRKRSNHVTIVINTRNKSVVPLLGTGNS